jgi:hypothetical protein
MKKVISFSVWLPRASGDRPYGQSQDRVDPRLSISPKIAIMSELIGPQFVGISNGHH